MTENHAFAIPVYGQPPHLAACIESILHQSRRSAAVVLCTSTPSGYLEEIAEKYQVPLLVHPLRVDIATDWNFALTATDADLVTIAHQDDLYAERYFETMSAALQRHPETSIAFSDFEERTPLGPRRANANVSIKRALCRRAFGRAEALESPQDKRRLLNLGNPVCCPSVVIHRRRLPDFRFSNALHTDLDWEAWARLAKLPGKFVYVREPLVFKLVHAGSETSATISNRLREREDRLMFEQFWPVPVAAAIAALYRLGYLANRV